MAYTAHYGTEATTGNSTFRIVLYTETTYNVSNYTVKYYYTVEVTKGNFNSTKLTVSWQSSTVTIGAIGTPHTSSTFTETINYGTTKTISATGKYSSSSTTYTSSVSYTVPVPKYVKVYDGSAWKNAIPFVYDGSAWKPATPMVYNGSKWVECTT